MGKRKAEDLSVDSISGGSKKSKYDDNSSATKPSKMSTFMDDSDDSGSDEDGGTKIDDFKINEEYARKLEYNKKREELQRCSY